MFLFLCSHGPISAEVCAQMGRFAPSLLLPPTQLCLKRKASCNISVKKFESCCPGPCGHPTRSIMGHLWGCAQVPHGHRKQSLGRPLVSILGKHPRMAHSPLSISRIPGPNWVHLFPEGLSSGIQGLQPTPNPSIQTSPRPVKPGSLTISQSQRQTEINGNNLQHASLKPFPGLLS